MNGGRPLRSLVIALLVLAVTLPVAALADSHTPGFQLQADGLLFGPTGKLSPKNNHVPLSDVYGNGGGFALTGTVGLTRHWVVGIRVASYRGTKDQRYYFNDLYPTADLSVPAGSGPYTQEHELRLLPVHALLQYRQSITPSVEGQVEGGFGVLSTIDHVSLVSTQGHGTLSSISGYQRDPSWSLGLGLGVKIPGNMDVVGSARYCSTFSSDGAAWLKDDDPSFTNWTLGLRYPHDTR
jgi:opacity protein-like surface antigen